MERIDYLIGLHAGTERQGPGSEAATLKALSMVRLPEGGRILDVGCGGGGQTLTLLKNTSADIVATDRSGIFLKQLETSASAQGLSGRLRIVQADMNSLPFGDGEFDCVWSEGSAFIIGYSRALKEWRRLIKPGGFLAVSDMVFTGDVRPREVTDFWTGVYPESDTFPNRLKLAGELGYEVAGSFLLPKSDWRLYYDGVRRRLGPFSAEHRDDPAVAAYVKETEEEIAFYEKYSDHFTYGFCVLRNK